ncbi:MAG: hypothetical protein R3A80_12655 [Bdellovibrionota bacterium]
MKRCIHFSFSLLSLNISQAGFFDFLKKTAVDIELQGMPYYAQSNTQWCWIAVSQMAIQYKNSKKVSQCKLISDTINKACCSNTSACNRGGFVEAVVPKYGLKVDRQLPNTSVVDASIASGKVPVMYLYNKKLGIEHYAIIQAKYQNAKGYRVYDPWYGILDLSNEQMKSRYVHEDYIWVGTTVVR